MRLTIHVDRVVAGVALPRAERRALRAGEVLTLDARGREVDVALDLLPGVRLSNDGSADRGRGMARFGGYCFAAHDGDGDGA